LPLRHVVAEGEGISKIAERYGINPQTIWDDAGNATLREQRPDPNVLLPDDVLVIPDKVLGSASCATGKRHVFRRLGVPALFVMQLLDAEDAPRTGIAYTLEVDGVAKNGTTDDTGMVRQWVPCASQSGRLLIGEGDAAEEYALEFGDLRPLSDTRGVQQRLRNLGFTCPVDGDAAGAALQSAIARFQAWAGLAATGILDDATRAEIGKLHDSTETPESASE